MSDSALITGNLFHLLFLFLDRRLTPIFTLFITFFLFLNIDATVLVKILQERAHCIVFHVALAAYLKGLQIMSEIVVYDIDSSFEIDELVISMRFSISNRLEFFYHFLSIFLCDNFCFFCACYSFLFAFLLI